MRLNRDQNHRAKAPKRHLVMGVLCTVVTQPIAKVISNNQEHAPYGRKRSCAQQCSGARSLWCDLAQARANQRDHTDPKQKGGTSLTKNDQTECQALS